MPSEIHSPLYDESTVAPKVFPTAISLFLISYLIKFIVLGDKKKQNIPHAGAQLDQTTVSHRRTNHNVRLRDVPSTHLDTTQNEGSQSETEQTQRCRVRKLTLPGTLPQTRLHFTTERGQRGGRRVHMCQRSIVCTGGDRISRSLVAHAWSCGRSAGSVAVRFARISVLVRHGDGSFWVVWRLTAREA